MKCPKCNSDVEMMVNLTILCPAEMESHLSKKNLRKKEVKIYAANWERASYFCKNNECRWTLLPDYNLKNDFKDGEKAMHDKIMKWIIKNGCSDKGLIRYLKEM